MTRTLRMFAALAPLVAFAPVAAQSAANTPVVTVLMFDNGSFGPGARDYDGIGKGIMDVLITDLASGTKVRVVDRERINKILEEQNLTKSGAIDGTTAIRVGKLFGACYSIYGSYMRAPNGEQTLTLHTTSNETGQITNAQKIQSKNDDVMALISEATTKFINGMNVSACTGTAGARRTGDASPAPAAQQQAAAPTPAVQQQAAAPAPAPAGTKLYAKELTAPEKAKWESMKKDVKLDARSMLLYSRGLDAKDRKENAKAVALFKQVKDKYPTFQPALDQLQALNAGN